MPGHAPDRAAPPGGGGLVKGDGLAKVERPVPADEKTTALAPSVRSDLIKLFITLFLYIFSSGLMLPNVPVVIKSFGGGDTSTASVYLGAATATHATMEFLFNPVLGELSDHYGRKWIMVLSIFGNFVSAMALAFAPSFAVLISLHTLAGSMGITFGMSYAIITDVSEKRDVSKHFGLVGVAFGAGFVLGPGIGGYLGSLSLRLPFYVAAGVLAADVLITALLLRETNVGADMRNKPFSWRAASPFHALGILNRTPMLRCGTAVLFLSGLAAGSYAVFVLYSGHRLGWGMREVGAFLAMVGTLACIMQGLIMPRLLPRIGDRRLLTWGLVGNIIQFCTFAMAVHWGIAYTALVFSSLGFLIGPLLRSLMAKMVDEHEQGALQGAMGGVSTLTRVFGPLVATQSFGLVTREGFAAACPSGALLFAEGLPFWIAGAFSILALALEVWALARYPPALAEDGPAAFRSHSPPPAPAAPLEPGPRPFSLSSEPVGGAGRPHADRRHVCGPDAL